MSKRVKSEYDLVIVGSGIAGLSFALKVPRPVPRCHLHQERQGRIQHQLRPGGIAAVTSAKDDLDKHIDDTLEAGDGLYDPEIVREILRDGPARFKTRK